MNVESRQKARLWLLGVFVLGAAIGGVFGYSFAHHKTLAAGPSTTPAQMSTEPERRARRVVEMTKELGLTAEQAATIDGIIHRTHDQMKAIHEKSDADVDAARQNGRTQIRQILTEEQKPKFEAMVQRNDAERRKSENRK